jgi:hypothetical protein
LSEIWVSNPNARTGGIHASRTGQDREKEFFQKPFELRERLNEHGFEQPLIRIRLQDHSGPGHRS